MKINKDNKRKVITLLEIILTISIVVTTSYLINESSKGMFIGVSSNENKISKISIILSFIGNILFNDIKSVSALDSVSTCLKDKNGLICQEYNSNECASKCNGTCIPARRDSVAECKLGTCFDKVEGTCTTQSPKKACEGNNGKWFSDPNANVEECQRSCCILGDNAFFVTQQQCNRASALLGIDATFNTDIRDELSCLILSKIKEEGACTFTSEERTTCKFAAKEVCLGLNGEFHSGYLCSSKELNTDCNAQEVTKCIEGKDEIYWFDSCGNQENIYEGSSDAQKDKSWNNGKILPKKDSCSLGDSNNQFANKGTCGNCFYLTGSRCGLKTDYEKLIDSSQDVVCRDLTCRDENGNIRQNGESWCAYDSAIGIEPGSGVNPQGEKLMRAVDTPGSEHFRKVCKDGDITTEPCGGYRNQICVESKAPLDNGKTISSAACKFNTWQNCMEYNYDLKDEEDKEAIAEECNKNPDCFMKEVNIADNFKFSLCSPKYPPGFSFTSGSDSMAKKLCSYGTQTCKVIYVKQIDGWECKANCDCESAKFTEQMNDMCMSLGDCGAEVNYNGDLTENYKVTNAPKLGRTYLEGLEKYADVIPGKVAEPGEFTGSISGFLDNKDPSAGEGGGMDFLQMGFGAAGALLPMLAAKLTSGITYTIFTGYETIAAKGIEEATKVASQTGGVIASSSSPAMAGLATALKAAGAVVAVAAILYQIYSFAAGGDYMMAGIVAATAIAATAVTMAVTNTGFTSAAGGIFTMAGASTVFPIVGIVVVAVVMILQFALGLGKTREVNVVFKCKPWQPPIGGQECDKCGENGLPCTAYSCSALGQTCQLVNEGTSKQACVDISPNDVSAPVITPSLGVITKNYSYTDLNSNGFKIKNNKNEGCIEAYTQVTFGVNTSEYAYCKYDSIHTTSFSEMSEDFGDNYYQKSHEMSIFMPSLESLGLPGYDPARKADYNLYVRCQDKNGNANLKEYNINFCVKPGIDLTPPIVNARLPGYEYVKYNAMKINASIYTNEPSECRYDSEDVSYDLMANQMQCLNTLSQQEAKGWRCDAEFSIPENDSVYYINCKDQPWLVESPDGMENAKIIVPDDSQESGIREMEVTPDRKRNSMVQNYQYLIKKSKSELQIDSIKPNGETIKAAVQPVSVDVEVKTSGGSEEGSAECMYRFNDNYINFYNTFNTVHTQTFQSMTSGEKEMEVKCIDFAGNAAYRNTTFRIEIDVNPPEITRVYNSGGLTIVTDEESTCSYTNEFSSDCDFTDKKVYNMTGEGLVHTTSLDVGLTYYIKCKDKFGKGPGGCSKIVQGGI